MDVERPATSRPSKQEVAGPILVRRVRFDDLAGPDGLLDFMGRYLSPQHPKNGMAREFVAQGCERGANGLKHLSMVSHIRRQYSSTGGGAADVEVFEEV